jgi:hypothetical protein
MTRFAPAALVAVLACTSVLSACSPKGVQAPEERGGCWHTVFFKGGEEVKFNKIGSNVRNLESCAAILEGMRMRFGTLAGQRELVVGAYQGQYIFLQREGVLTSNSLTGARYVAMVRTGDGRLAIPGAMPPAPK